MKRFRYYDRELPPEKLAELGKNDCPRIPDRDRLLEALKREHHEPRFDLQPGVK